MEEVSERRVWRIVFGDCGDEHALETYGSLHEARLARAQLVQNDGDHQPARVLAIVSEEESGCVKA